MKKLILYISTLLLVIIGLNFLKPSNIISHVYKNYVEIKNVNTLNKTPLANSNFNSLFPLAEVEDDYKENELQSAYLLIKNSVFNFSFLNNEYKLTSSRYTNSNWYRFYGLPIYTAINNFRI